MRFNTFLSSSVSLLMVGVALSGCTKYNSFEGYAYDCECGELTWGDRALNMRMAEAEVISEDSTVWRYHVVADLRRPPEIENRDEPRDIVMTIQATITGDSTHHVFAAGDEAFALQEVDSPGYAISWAMEGAELSISTSSDAHTLVLHALSANRSGNVVDAQGVFTFDLED